MFSFKPKAQQADKYLGICLHPHAISSAVVQKTPEGELQLDYLDHRAVTNSETLSGELKILLTESSARNLPTVLVLDRAHYSLLQLETPEVGEDELNNAVKWRIKDLIDFPVDELSLELIPLPDSKRPGMPKIMYVVAARRSVLRELIGHFDLLDQPVHAIDVPELTLRNLMFADSEENRATAFLYMSPRQSLIEICKEGTLCLSRHVMLDLDSMSLHDEQKRLDTMDMMSLEVQRSLDYYESHFADGAASKISLVSATDISITEFIEVAGSYLVQPMAEPTALQQIKGIERFNPRTVADCLPALGGALRNLVWTA